MVTRRDLIVAGLAAGTTAAVMPLVNRFDLTDISTKKEDSKQLRAIESGLGKPMDDLLQSLKGADQLGEAWVNSLEATPTLEQLGKIVSQRVDVHAIDIPTITATRIKKDFVENNLCLVEGWHLSLTECQLAGLLYLAIASNPGNQAYLHDNKKPSLADQYTVGEIATLRKWGPKETYQGKKFNEQRDGHSGLWFQIQGAPAHAKIMVDGQLLKTSVRENVVTSGLRGKMQDRILSTPGEYEVALVDPVKKIKQPIGELRVKFDPRQAKAEGELDSVFCKVTTWGPKKTLTGIANNAQKDGSMGIWLHTDCLPEGARLMFVDDLLQTTPKSFGLTSSIPLPLLGSPGKKPLYLYDEISKDKQLVGYLTIE